MATINPTESVAMRKVEMEQEAQAIKLIEKKEAQNAEAQTAASDGDRDEFESYNAGEEGSKLVSPTPAKEKLPFGADVAATKKLEEMLTQDEANIAKAQKGVDAANTGVAIRASEVAATTAMSVGTAIFTFGMTSPMAAVQIAKAAVELNTAIDKRTLANAVSNVGGAKKDVDTTGLEIAKNDGTGDTGKLVGDVHQRKGQVRVLAGAVDAEQTAKHRVESDTGSTELTPEQRTKTVQEIRDDQASEAAKGDTAQVLADAKALKKNK